MATRAFLQTLCTPSPQALIASAVLDWRLGRRGGSSRLLRGQSCSAGVDQALDGRCRSKARPGGRARRLRARRAGRWPRLPPCGRRPCLLPLPRGGRVAADTGTPLAEYSRSTAAFVVCRVTRQIFATMVSGSRLPRAGLSITERPTHSPSTSVSKFRFGMAAGALRVRLRADRVLVL